MQGMDRRSKSGNAEAGRIFQVKIPAGDETLERAGLRPATEEATLSGICTELQADCLYALFFIAVSCVFEASAYFTGKRRITWNRMK